MKTTKRKFYSNEYGWLEEVSFKVLNVTVWREINPCPPIEPTEVIEAKAIRQLQREQREVNDFSHLPTLSNEAFDQFQKQMRYESYS